MAYPAGVPRYLQIAEALRARIRQADGEGRGRLPSEHALCAEFKVSRPTVRQALNLLSEEGLLIRQRGRGTFVTRAPEQERSLRVIGSIEDMIALGNETRYKPLERAIVKPPTPVARALRLAKNASVVRFVGVRSNDEGPFQHVIAYLPEALGQPLLQEDLTTTSVIATVERRLGIAVKFSEQVIDVARAPKAVADLLGVPPRAPLLHFQRTYFNEGGEPIEFAVSYQSAERFPYRVMLYRSARRG
ncbi:MAG: GntR family transcriptional regulator [Candidatus Rokubacteria bacterium]|nr:GntR family transcriptional regulator [Candidatus Rokubacteria bacterium]